MTGGNPKGSSTHKPSPSTSNRISKWGSAKNPPPDNKSGKNPTPDNKSGKNPHYDNKSNNNPSAADTKFTKPPSNLKDDPSSGPSKPSPNQIPPPGPGAPLYNEPSGAPFADPSGFGAPPPPAYGFHMLDRRTIALADGSVRSYFALPPDYQDLPPPQGRPPFDRPERFFPFGQGERDAHFPHGRRLSPEGFLREELYRNSLGIDGRGPMPQEASLKRKYGDGDERDGRDGGRDSRDEFARQRQQLLQYGNPNLNPNGFPSGPGELPGHMAGTSSPFHPLDPGRGLEDMRAPKNMRIGGDYDLSSGRGMPSGDAAAKHHDVDQQALKKAFLRFVKLINENTSQKANYLENGKQGPLRCLACGSGRASKEFPDMHGLIMHAYSSHGSDLHVDHLGLHKALCVLMGWNYTKVPDSSKGYQSISTNEAEANRDDLILWPPLVIIHNTNSGRNKDGRMEGMGNTVMDKKLKDLGFGGGKAKSVYGKDGHHQGITLVKFAADQSGLKEAMRLAEYFEKDYHGRNGWGRAEASLQSGGRDDENNPNLVKVDDKSREKQRILYGYLATALDLEKVDNDTRKKSSIESKRDLKP